MIGLMVSCSHTSPRQFATTVMDEKHNHVRNVVLVPVVNEYKALGVGPDGAGIEGKPVGFIAKPFLWSSGDDLIPQKLKSSGIMFLPLVGARKDVTVRKWLLLKKGYEPLLINNDKDSVRRIGGYYLKKEPSEWRLMDANMVAKNRKKLMSKAPVFNLIPGGDLKRKQLINALTSVSPDIEKISDYFNFPISQIRFSNSDKSLIRMQE